MGVASSSLAAGTVGVNAGAQVEHWPVTGLPMISTIVILARGLRDAMVLLARTYNHWGIIVFFREPTLQGAELPCRLRVCTEGRDGRMAMKPFDKKAAADAVRPYPRGVCKCLI